MLRAACVIAVKDFRLLVRDRAAFFFTFVFPLVYGLMFGFMFSGGGGNVSVPIAVHDSDQSERSALFLERLEAKPQLEIYPIEDPATGPDAVRRGDVAVYLHIPEGFGEAIATPILGGTIRLEGNVDPSRTMALGMTQGMVAETLFGLLSESFSDPEEASAMIARSRELLADSDTNPATKFLLGAVFNNVDQLIATTTAPEESESDTPAEETTDDGASPLSGIFSLDLADTTPEGRGPANAFEITMPQGAAWALMGCLFGFASSLVQERGRGTMPRLLAAPIRPSAILGGKAVGCFVSAIVVQVFLLAVGAVLLDVRIHSLVTAGMAVTASAAGFVGIMMLLASLGKTEAGTEGMGRAVMLILALCGGAAVPMDFLNIEWIQKVSYISPFRWSILATEGAIWRGFSAGEMLLPCGVLVAIGVVGVVVGAKLFGFQGGGDR